MVCQGALEALVTVVITGKVGFSALGTDPRSEQGWRTGVYGTIR